MKHSFYARNMNLRSRRLAREIFETLFRMKKLLLFWSMILGFGTALSAQTSVAKGHIGLYTKDIGKIKVTVVTDGHLPVKPVQAEFAQRVDSVKVAETLKNGFSSPREVDLAMNVLLLEYGEKLILIDAGAGTVFGDGCGHLAENLSYAGISPEEITDVVLTHAHPDHIAECGGLAVGYRIRLLDCFRPGFFKKHHDGHGTHANARGGGAKEYRSCRQPFTALP